MAILRGMETCSYPLWNLRSHVRSMDSYSQNMAIALHWKNMNICVYQDLFLLQGSSKDVLFVRIRKDKHFFCEDFPFRKNPPKIRFKLLFRDFSQIFQSLRFSDFRRSQFFSLGFHYVSKHEYKSSLSESF